MNNINRENSAKSNFGQEKEHVSHLLDEEKQRAKNAYKEGKEAAESLYSQTKESVSELYEEGKKKVEHAQDALKDYSNELVKIVKDKPLSSLLVASGVGFLLSSLLRK